MLDELFEYGTTTFFLKAAMQAVQRFEVEQQQFHLDSTSFALDGEYVQNRTYFGTSLPS